MPGWRIGRTWLVAAACAALATTTASLGLAPAHPAAAQAAPGPADEPVDLATVRPVDTPGIDPVLDAVEVDATPALHRADAHLEEVAGAQRQATLRWIQAEQRRAAMAGRSGSAAQRAAAAQVALGHAQLDQVAAEQVLRVRRREEARLRARLAVEQGRLRTLAAGLLATAPEDAYAVLGSLRDITEADRRNALRDRGLALQSQRVDRAHRPWATAHRARVRQDRRVRRAQAETRRAARAAATAIDERDRFGAVLHALEDKVRTAADELIATQADTSAVLIERRAARLAAPVSNLDLSLVALDAYWRASALAPCSIPWWVIAGVGKVETRHGTAFGSTLTPDGDTTVHILGIPLDGRPGTRPVADTDGGLLDDDPTWDRAIGPMQFIPGTWGRWAADGNADQKADPHNIYDAAGAAAAYLCFTRGDLDTEAKQRQAVLAYNRSDAYASKVLAEGGRYRDALDLPEVAPRPPAPGASPEGQ